MIIRQFRDRNLVLNWIRSFDLWRIQQVVLRVVKFAPPTPVLRAIAKPGFGTSGLRMRSSSRSAASGAVVGDLARIIMTAAARRAH